MAKEKEAKERNSRSPTTILISLNFRILFSRDQNGLAVMKGLS
jgi:hypothetical protein